MFFKKGSVVVVNMKWVLQIFSSFLILLMIQNIDAQTPKEFAVAWDKSRISNKFPSNVRHKDVKAYLKQLKKLGIKVDEVGRSFQDREIFQIEWGKGKTKVFMWSQMHGDEPTATSALIDMFAFLETNRKKRKWVRMLERSLTIRAVPMLNPDGAELFKRRNLQGVDINRDTKNLETPEANLLMRLRNEFEPEIGFNLHNQQELTSVGQTTNLATISVLAVRANPETEVSEGQKRNDRICALIISALSQFIKGNIARYDDGYTASAFGDTFSDMGTPVILIETGGTSNHDEMFLTKLNFVAFLTALQSLVDGSEAKADANLYRNLPENGGGRVFNYIFRNATVVDFEEVEVSEDDSEPIGEGDEPKEKERVFKPFMADVGVNRRRRRAEIKTPPTYVRSVGDLSRHRGLKEFNANGFYIFGTNGVVKSWRGGALLFYKKTRKIDWEAEDLEKHFPPDAIFARGRWIKGGELFTK